MVILEDIDAAIASKDPNSRSGRLARNSLFVLRERWAPTMPPLRIELGQNRKLSASELARITQALQDATAKVAMLIIRPSKDQVRVTQAARERAELIPRSTSGNVMYFDFPENIVSGTDTPLPLGPIPHLAEQAVRELIENMPETTQDERALALLPSRRLAIRSAVSTLAAAVKSTSGLTMTLANRQGEADSSVLTVDQAREVPDLLSATSVETEVFPVDGVMDGMRTRRRLFYLIESEATGGREFEGSIGLEQLDSLQRAMGLPVIARIRKTVNVRADGTRSHPSYSLVDFTVPQTLA